MVLVSRMCPDTFADRTEPRPLRGVGEDDAAEQRPHLMLGRVTRQMIEPCQQYQCLFFANRPAPALENTFACDKGEGNEQGSQNNARDSDNL